MNKSPEFSSDHAAFAGLACKHIIGEITGRDPDEAIEETFLRNLMSLKWETLSTTKASSSFVKNLETGKHEILKGRPRAMAAVADVAKLMGFRPIHECFVELLHTWEAQGAMYIDLFNKQQHGGKREIYVLDGLSRVMQAIVEVMGKTICSFFENETMTHPSNKQDLQTHHHRRARSYFNNPKHVNSSNDASKWCFTFSVPVLMTTFMLAVVPKKYKPFTQRAFDMWAHKFILIPKGLRDKYEFVCPHI